MIQNEIKKAFEEAEIETSYFDNEVVTSSGCKDDVIETEATETEGCTSDYIAE